MARRRKTAKKAAKKRVAKKRVVKKRPARKAAKRRVVKKRVVKKRPARKAAKRRVVKKRVAKKRPARKAAKKRVVKKRPVRKAAKRRAAPAAFAPQKARASAKDLLLLELERARVAVLAAIQGLGAGSAVQPMGDGRWSIHETILHLAVRDRVRLDEFDSMLAGNPGSWAGVEDPADQADMNESQLAPLRGLMWDDAVRLLMTTREELVERLRAVPAEPAEVWRDTHPFGAMMHRLPAHDRGHADAIKNARIAG